MKFISVMDRTERPILINVEMIGYVSRFDEDGTAFIELFYRDKERTRGFCTSESYADVCRKISRAVGEKDE